jgi:hypothetical protein
LANNISSNSRAGLHGNNINQIYLASSNSININGAGLRSTQAGSHSSQAGLQMPHKIRLPKSIHSHRSQQMGSHMHHKTLPSGMILLLPLHPCRHRLHLT